MKLDTVKIKGLFSRVLNNKMDGTDQADIQTYIKKVFGDGGTTPDPSMLHQFNNLVVEQADEIAKPKVTQLLSFWPMSNKKNEAILKKLKFQKE